MKIKMPPWTYCLLPKHRRKLKQRIEDYVETQDLLRLAEKDLEELRYKKLRYSKNMTNFDRWQLFMRDVTSPQSFVDFGFYYLIAAALQRRVWVGPEHRKLYSNIYVILVADPGIGKGLVIKPVTEMLKFHKLKVPGAMEEDVDSKIVDVDPALVEAIAMSNVRAATDNNPSVRKPAFQKPLVIPVAADSTTYEALLQDMSRATRRINYKQWDEKLKKHKVAIYVHASLCFALEEISSLFAKHTENVVNCLLKLYDCGDYDRITKTQGSDHIMNCCLNLLGGTTPGFMQSVFNDKLLTEGFSSRAWFVFETANRFNTLMAPELTTEQQQAFKDLVEHVGKLTTLYGQVKYTTEAWSYLENWWKNIHPTTKANSSMKMIAYYARKNIHVQKLAMILHFAEDATHEDGVPKNPITLAECQRAMAILDNIEKRMHYAINFDSKNPLSRVARSIVQFIEREGPQSDKELLAEFWDDARGHEMKEIVEHLLTVRKIHQCPPDEKLKIIRYDIPRKLAETLAETADII